MIRRSSLIALEVLLGLATACAIGLGVAWWRLSQGPVEVSFIREHVAAELSRARAGRPVSIARIELAWSREGGALELRAIDVAVEDGADHVISRSREALIELGVMPLLWGRIALERAEFDGGELTITRRADGAVALAFGPPGAPADLVIPAPPPDETLAQRVGRILDGLEQAFRPVGAGARLKRVAARGVKFMVIDEAGGGEWRADGATFELSRQEEALELSAAAEIEGLRERAPAQLHVATDTAFTRAIVDFAVQDARPRALLSPAALGRFAGLDAPLTASISVGLDRKIGVTRLEGDAELGAGEAQMGAERFRVDGGGVRGRYDLESDELVIDRISLAGARTEIRGEIRVSDASRVFSGAPAAVAVLNVSVPALDLAVPGVFSAPITLSNITLAGKIDGAARAVTFDALQFTSEKARFDGTGRLYWAPAGADGALRPGLSVAGALEGEVSGAQVMAFWPIGLGEGAREMVAAGLIAGRASDVTVRADITPADVAAGALRNESLDVRFNFDAASFRFISTMSPIVNARGAGVLRGNRFDLTVREARLNDLAVTRGVVEFPRLKPKGAMARFSAHAEGDARKLSELLVQEPLGLAEALPYVVDTTSGTGVVDFELRRPMLSDVTFADMRMSLNAHVTGFAADMRERPLKFSEGRLSVRGDHNALTIAGPVRLGDSRAQVNWTERIGAERDDSSRFQISGAFSAHDLVALGYEVASYARGPVHVSVSGVGRGERVKSAHVALDLANAALTSPFAYFEKPAGPALDAQFDVARSGDGFAIENLSARGAGATARGSVRVNARGDITGVDLSRFVIAGRTNARVSATRTGAGVLAFDVRGVLFDATPFMNFAAPPPPSTSGPAPPDQPVSAEITVNQLGLRGGALLNGAHVSVRVARGALQTLVARGLDPRGGTLSLGLGPRAEEPSGRVAFAADDAGFAMRALTGANNIVGGAARAQGSWRAGPPSRGEFTVQLNDFRVVRLPAMAQLLSSAGSLTGLADMLNGEGIGFSSLEAPMVYDNGAIIVREARASGPSLGITAGGAYDIGRDNLDIDGVVVPSYGVNSFLGGVPILGDLLVSRRGEGIVGMTYSINGAVAEPRVGVNPLSALTPGILRRIFEPFAPRRVAEERAPAAPRANASNR